MEQRTNPIKQFVYTSAYIHLYPLAKHQGIAKKINEYDYTLNDSFAKDINDLYGYIQSEMAKGKIDKEINERGLEGCYKKKRVKVLDEETGEKTVEKIKYERKGVINKNILNSYSEQIKTLSKDTQQLSLLSDNLLEGNLTDFDLPQLDKILKRNRFRLRAYIAGIIVILAVIVSILIILR